ncbi:hypothetical protein K443DRAFT_124517 [Laccaria amethystina LaAM-08-1]|uniref:Uncharacterized protein n=1 Tax=Laccaria amethystina LaAM-08-1 TaxID=1095629 RepID=A0A0C9XJ01_9AGAR|nr:hypothetical protein K443DRAFT_124517 [Laccaria amethystina LaAM-08-1]
MPDEISNAKNTKDAMRRKRTDTDNGKPRVCQEWQVYQKMTYQTQWKTEIDKEWDALTKKWEAENPGQPMKALRFNFMNTFLQAKYTEESEEVKDKVRKRQEAMKEEGSGDNSDKEADAKNKVFQKAIDKLSKTLASMGAAINAQTGWHVSFLVGGPEPRQSGKIITFMLHCEKSATDQTFEEYLGKEEYEKSYIEPFDDFLHDSFHDMKGKEKKATKEKKKAKEPREPRRSDRSLLLFISNISLGAPASVTLPLVPVPSVPSVTPDNVASALIPLATSTPILNDGNIKPTTDARAMDTDKNLPTTSRLEEVKAWMRNKKKDLPPAVDVDAYGPSFMAWWIVIQPTWRLANNSSFIYETPGMEDWRSLQKGGASGLYTIIIALSWWIKALSPADSSICAWTAIHDVNWVIDQIYEKIGGASQGKKQGCEEPSTSGKGKSIHN